MIIVICLAWFSPGPPAPLVASFVLLLTHRGIQPRFAAEALPGLAPGVLPGARAWYPARLPRPEQTRRRFQVYYIQNPKMVCSLK